MGSKESIFIWSHGFSDDFARIVYLLLNFLLWLCPFYGDRFKILEYNLLSAKKFICKG